MKHAFWIAALLLGSSALAHAHPIAEGMPIPLTKEAMVPTSDAHPYPFPTVPPVVEDVQPLPPVSKNQQVWHPGSWEWSGTQYVWHGGHWMETDDLSTHAMWQPGYWSQMPDQKHYVWLPGHWQ